MRIFLGVWQTWLWSAALLAGAILAALICHSLFFAAASSFARRTGSSFDQALTRHAKKPARFIFPLLAVLMVLPALRFPQGVMQVLERISGLSLIAAVAWLIVIFVDVASDLIAFHYRIDVKDNLTARKIGTQIQMMRRIIVVLVIMVTLALMLMTFPSIRHIGDTLLASAGLAGLVVGLAARSTFSNLIAGVQLALTEPIRIEDAVRVNGEFGWIEEITTTYVVVRIWDLRRMVVPLTYFIEKPFENWTHKTSDLLAKVFIYADYSVPVEEVRQELQRILESSGMWDGKVCKLQVSSTSEHAVEMRALMSAPDAPTAWNLGCHVREKLIGFLQQRYPRSLPKTREEIQNAPPN